MRTGVLLLLLLILFGSSMAKWERDLIVNFCADHVNVRHAVVFGCSSDDNDPREDYFDLMKKFIDRLILVRFIDLDGRGRRVDLKDILTRFLAASTCVVLDMNCNKASYVLNEASSYGYFNKSYQWLLHDLDNVGLGHFVNSTNKIGVNAQVTYVNSSNMNDEYILYDLHSKGQHLKAPLIITPFANWSAHQGFNSKLSLEYVQGIRKRRQFGGRCLRGVIVVDRDDIRPTDLDLIMSNPVKTAGISPFTKYHYALVLILKQYFNFTINYRITHGWAGRLPNSSFRLGLLGVIQRDEADIAASGAFDRINRFAEMDTIHQSWKFEAAFLYRITADIKDSRSNGSGGFLAPFGKSVWIAGLLAIVAVILVWKASVQLGRLRLRAGELVGDYSVGVNIVAVVCQQGLVQPPKCMSTRIIAFAMLIFSLLMYNFYTSSVVGGLLSTKAQGPRNSSQLMDSPLILSFEDIGYHKVIFRETNSSLLKTMYRTKIQPYRNPNLLPAYTTINDAVPYLRTGRYAFHCEMIDAYPEIARLFDPNEICDLRSVSGLFDIQIMNMIVTKRSAYTEMFRIALHRAREIGLINRELKAHRPEKPRCQSGSTVHPVTLNGVKNAFVIFGGAIATSFVLLLIEVLVKRLYFGNIQ